MMLLCHKFLGPNNGVMNILIAEALGITVLMCLSAIGIGAIISKARYFQLRIKGSTSKSLQTFGEILTRVLVTIIFLPFFLLA
jgi:uncharacterized membrane-anchored protein